jgi:hypothetical protein
MQYQSPEPQHRKQFSRQYLIGIGIGCVPLIIAWIGIGSLFAGNGIFSSFLGIALVLYVALLVASIVCLSIKEVRYVGYGLLTMFIVSPIISFIGCLVITAHPR